MGDKRFAIVIICAALFGLVAAALVGRYLTNVEGRSNSIVVAKADIPLSTRITPEQLTIQQLPRDVTPAGSFTDIAKVAGRVTVTRIGAREPLTELKLAPEGAEPGLTAVISEGYRAITVKVDDVVGVAGLVEPGAWVDVVAVIEPAERSSHRGPTSKIVLQRIRVLATNQSITKEEKEKKSGLLSIKAVTLEVLPSQAEKLALAAAEGKLQLVMRNSVDKDDVATPGVNKNSLLTGDPVILPTEEAAPAAEAPRTAIVRYRPPSVRAARPARPANPDRTLPPSLRLMPMEPTPPKPRSPQSMDPARPAPPRLFVEVFDGAKRNRIDLP